MHTETAFPFVVGGPNSFRSLTIIPLFPKSEPTLEYLGLDEAVASGLVVTEIDEYGSVPTLRVLNPLDSLVLIYEGEEVTGAKQNRIFNQSVLAPRQSQTAVPVTCVEANRWQHGGKWNFDVAPQAAYPSLRSARYYGGQSEAWEQIAEKSMRLDVRSPTSAVDEIYTSRRVEVDAFVQALPRADGQCGAIVAIGGVLSCIDAVSRSDVWAGLYPKLLRGYALDAVESPFDVDVDAEVARDWIDRYEDAERMPAPLVGFGTQLEFSLGSGVGSSLVVGDETIAFAAIPTRTY